MAPFTQTVTLVRRTKGEPDDLGNDTWTETEVDVQAVVGVINGSEQLQGRNTGTKRAPIYLAPGTDVERVDAVVIAGESWEIEGEPTRYMHALTGWRPGVEVNLIRVTG